MVNEMGLRTMRSQVQIPVEEKTLGDFFQAFVDNGQRYPVLELVGDSRYPVKLVEVHAS